MIYLIRGLPGAGKSTIATALRDGGLVDLVVSADDYMVDDRGEYCFDPQRLTECHHKCLAAVRTAVQRGQSVAVANTFVRRWEMASYYGLGAGGVIELTVNSYGRFKSVHDVPQATIDRMRRQWEP